MAPTQHLDDALLTRASVALAAAEGRADGWISVADYRSVELESVSAGRVAEHRSRMMDVHRRVGGFSIVEAGSNQYPRLLLATGAAPQRSVLVAAQASLRGPRLLLATGAAPQLLFVQGQIPSDPDTAVAVVGSRDASPGAKAAARTVAAALADAGAAVVSGLAKGIDTAGHLGALDVAGTTIAVLGTGIGVTYPPENTRLAQRITETGAVVSQFPPAAGPSKTSFPARNAVTAGLSHASVVIEANERSGTRIEMNLSLRFKRPVLFWAPIMGTRRWAASLAERPDVHMVASAAEILEICAAL